MKRFIFPFLLMLLLPAAVYPCTCSLGTISNKFASHTDVFLGTVSEIKRLEPNSLGEDRVQVKFGLEMRWKGSSVEAVLDTYDNKVSCEGYWFKEGKRYLVFAKPGENGLTVRYCGGVIEDAAKKEFEEHLNFLKDKPLVSVSFSAVVIDFDDPCGNPLEQSDGYRHPADWKDLLVTEVVDGATFKFLTPQGFTKEMKLGGVKVQGVDTEAGLASREFLSDLILGKRVNVWLHSSDHDEVLGGKVGGINEKMLLSGLAEFEDSDYLTVFDKCMFKHLVEESSK